MKRGKRIQIDFAEIEKRILVTLYDLYFGTKFRWFSETHIVGVLSQFPVNPVRDSLASLVEKGLVIQDEDKENPEVTSYIAIRSGNRVKSRDGYKISDKGIVVVNNLTEDDYSFLQTNNGGRNQAGEENAENWEPLKVEYDTEAASNALQSLEDAIDAIEQHNEFSEKLPKERDTVVSALKRNYQALRDRLISVGEVKEGLIKPLRYVVGLFATTTVGETAKKAIAALFSWLGW